MEMMIEDSVKVGEVISLHNNNEFLRCRDNIVSIQVNNLFAEMGSLLINLMIKNRKMKGGRL
ncbi:MAG: hypothetical protein AABW80_02485 [Nanoarchaeota archaeon]